MCSLQRDFFLLFFILVIYGQFFFNPLQIFFLLLWRVFHQRPREENPPSFSESSFLLLVLQIPLKFYYTLGVPRTQFENPDIIDF